MKIIQSEGLTAREMEGQLLDLCAQIARDEYNKPLTTRQANAVYLASQLLRRDDVIASSRLAVMSENHFVANNYKAITVQEMLANRWIIGLPRFRDNLRRRLGVNS